MRGVALALAVLKRAWGTGGSSTLGTRAGARKGLGRVLHSGSGKKLSGEETKGVESLTGVLEEDINSLLNVVDKE